MKHEKKLENVVVSFIGEGGTERRKIKSGQNSGSLISITEMKSKSLNSSQEV